MFRWLIFIAIYLIVDFYAFQTVKTVSKNKIFLAFFWIISFIVLANFIYQFTFNFDKTNGLNTTTSYAIGFLLITFIPKIVLLFFALGEDVFRVPQAAFRWFREGNSADINYFSSRRKFISQLAMGVAAIPFAGLLYGIYKGKFNYKVLSYELVFEDLPDTFDNYKIVQISDIHSGSFEKGNIEKIKYGINLINKQNADVLVFTGDLVNNKAEEMLPWMDTFGSLKAKDGKFSVLGNHDYGDYIDWKNKEEKQQNLKALKDIHRQLGFNLLLNQNEAIVKNGQKLNIIGVENWGAGRFKKAGDLEKAVSGVASDAFKIVLSHDPSHWEQQIKDHKLHYHLTLSGHTHGMQFGIEIPGWLKWSPIKWRYKYWAGLYKEKGQYLNVNRGFGYLAYPGRAGIWPEITSITLKKA
ncbi:MAG: phosphoesterase [Flavobacteriales bacterium]|nr:MAG: phosphoesterase [Flavobacteriales bacterium]